jgi:hypothetical protein
VQHQKIKETLKQYKLLLSIKLQDLGFSMRTIELPLTAALSRSDHKCHRILWPAAEVADLTSSRILGPAANDALVKVAFTLSALNELAQLLPGSYKHTMVSRIIPAIVEGQTRCRQKVDSIPG